MLWNLTMGHSFPQKNLQHLLRGIVFSTCPKYLQVNGETEKMVRTFKDLFSNSEDPHMAMIIYKDTAGVTEYNPSQLLLGRHL